MIPADPFQLVIPTALAILAALILCYLMWLLLPHSTNWLYHAKNLWKFRKALARIHKADELIETNQYLLALGELRKAIVLDVGVSQPLVISLKEHYQNVLSRCLIIAESVSAHLENIVEVEHLFLERSEILSLFVKSNQAYYKLTQRRGHIGKGIPSWSKADFEQRVADIRKELEQNGNKLFQALDQLFASLEAPISQHVTYH